VGFYSSFIVAEKVEVYTKAQDHPGIAWISDGSGEFVISEASNLNFDRGT
jgi:TNF receptor-associated protein 1